VVYEFVMVEEWWLEVVMVEEWWLLWWWKLVRGGGRKEKRLVMVVEISHVRERKEGKNEKVFVIFFGVCKK
jgi:hypothetical protein